MINTLSKFWYGWQIDATNCTLDFRLVSDIANRQAVLRYGRYSSVTLAEEIRRAMTEAGVIAIGATFNRSTKKFTLSTSVVFSILSNTGVTVGISSGWLYLGYSTGSNKTGATNYTADNTCVPFEYIPQFKLQSMTKVGDSIKLRDAVISETTTGAVELSHFGEIKPVEFEIVWITDITQAAQSVITTNNNGVADANRLLAWACKKGLVEFMPDGADPSTYYDLILDSTDSGQNGTDYKLTEDYARGLVNYYRSGKLTWRVYSE